MKCFTQSRPHLICTLKEDNMFKFKAPSIKTMKLMSEVAQGQHSDIDFENECREKISDLTSHKYVKMTSSGNNSIFIALSAIEGDIIIPDQGGWHGFKQIARFLNKNIIQLKTDLGVIKREYLDELEFREKSAIIFTSFAGYTAEQDTKSISRFCKSSGLTSIEDASAGIGDCEKRLGNGKLSDIIIASTGSPKMINAGSGGFITTDRSEIFEKSSLPQKLSKTNEIICSGIYGELDSVEKNLEVTLKATEHVKKHMDNVIHKDKRGVNVILPHENAKEIGWKLKKTLTTDKSGFITTCPNYNRVKTKAVAVEIKNLDYGCLEKEYMDKIIDELKTNNLQ